MDIKRSILLVALAVVAYLMVLQWNQDYGQAALPTETAQSQPAAPALPDSPSATTEGNADDVPAVAGQQQASALPASAPSSQLIRVRTDVLDLAIDPRGGDIVELHLPQYPRRQDRPDVPFQLFETADRPIVAIEPLSRYRNGPGSGRFRVSAMIASAA